MSTDTEIWLKVQYPELVDLWSNSYLNTVPRRDISTGEECLICHIRSNTGLHYGVFSCEADKQFLKRTFHEKQVYKICDLQCPPRFRGWCQYCRLKSSLLAGINLKMIRTNEKIKRNRSASSLEPKLKRTKSVKVKKTNICEQSSPQQTTKPPPIHLNNHHIKVDQDDDASTYHNMQAMSVPGSPQIETKPYHVELEVKKELTETVAEEKADPLEVETTSRLPQTYWNACMFNRAGQSGVETESLHDSLRHAEVFEHLNNLKHHAEAFKKAESVKFDGVEGDGSVYQDGEVLRAYQHAHHLAAYFNMQQHYRRYQEERLKYERSMFTSVFTTPSYNVAPEPSPDHYNTLLDRYNMVPTPLCSPPNDAGTPKAFRPIPRYPSTLHLTPETPRSNGSGFAIHSAQTPTRPEYVSGSTEVGVATSLYNPVDMTQTSDLGLLQHRRHDRHDQDGVYPINMLPSPPYTHSDKSPSNSGDSVQTEPLDLSSSSSTSFASSRPSSRCSTSQASRPPSNGSFASPRNSGFSFTKMSVNSAVLQDALTVIQDKLPTESCFNNISHVSDILSESNIV